MAQKCRKFVPNIFNKLKCQTCFGSKEQHSAEALENNKASRKVSKCGYLFVAPGYDFSNPLDKTRRWQRRFFVLYDDGELAYSVDENPDTVPQGVVDMNKCTDVKDASGSTSHQNSLSIVTPDKTTYIKANSKEEIQWWTNVLIKFPDANCIVSKKRYHHDDDKENIDTSNILPKRPKSEPSENQDGEETSSRMEVDKVKSKDGNFVTYRGVRSMKHNKENKLHQEGLRKSSSLHDLSTEERETGELDNSRFLSRSGDGLDKEEESFPERSHSNNPFMAAARSPTWKPSVLASKAGQAAAAKPVSSSNPSVASSGTASADKGEHQRRGSFDDKTLQTGKAKKRQRESPAAQGKVGQHEIFFPLFSRYPR